MDGLAKSSDLLSSAALLAAIVEGAEDAIISKTLDGRILSWNRGAERVFGHSAREVVGQPITIIFPDERLSEESDIMAKIRMGERHPPYLSVRRKKDGRLVDLSIAVSPIRAEDGRVVGAAKIARDVSPLRQEAERQALLAREINHRIKNLFAITSGLVLQSARQADSINSLVLDLNSRLGALARAHDLTLPDLAPEGTNSATTLRRLLEAIIAPYQDHSSGRIVVTGDDLEIGSSALTAIALVLHELITNAAKYGALAAPEGCLSVSVKISGESLLLTWSEQTGARLLPEAGPDGFGSFLESVSLKGLDATIKRQWNPHGLRIELSLPLRSIQR